jgi:hypothetical protein
MGDLLPCAVLSIEQGYLLGPRFRRPGFLTPFLRPVPNVTPFSVSFGEAFLFFLPTVATRGLDTLARGIALPGLPLVERAAESNLVFGITPIGRTSIVIVTFSQGPRDCSKYGRYSLASARVLKHFENFSSVVRASRESTQ